MHFSILEPSDIVAFLKCLQCQTVLESRHVHDFVRCACPNQTFLDGGNKYFRYGGVDMDKIQIIENNTVMSRISRSRIDEKTEYDKLDDDELVQKLDETLLSEK